VVGGGWYNDYVLKTSIYLDPEVDRALARRAAAEGTTKAELIREALAHAVASSRRTQPRAEGVFEGPGDLARNADHYLEQSGFGER
jgi:predicted transcriptional regulator